MVTGVSALDKWQALGVMRMRGSPHSITSGSYLVELGLAGEGRRGRDPALLTGPRIPSSLPKRRQGHQWGRGYSRAESPQLQAELLTQRPCCCHCVSLEWAVLTGAATWVPLARTRVFRPLLLRALLFTAPGSSNLLGV